MRQAHWAILSDNEIEEIKEKALRYLAERGVRVQHPGALRALEEAGARVEAEAQLVRFPRELLEAAIERAPKSFELAAPDRGLDVPLPHPEGGFYVCTGTGARGIIDPHSGSYRPLLLTDAQRWGRLVSALEHIDLCAFPTPTDVPPQTVDVHSLRQVLGSCAKHVWIQPHTEQTLPYLLELAATRAGGSGRLAERPVVSIIACALTPFLFKSMDVEVILQAGRRGVPIHASSLPVIGGTSPITLAGTVLTAGIEVLALTTLAQLLRPGAPVVGLATALSMDMVSGRAVKASPEAMLANAASAQFVGRAFGIPTHTAGLTSDMLSPDGQAMVEHSLYGLLVASAGAQILGRAGELEAAMTFSPLQLIVDNEIVAVLKRLRAGMEVDSESLAWQDIRRTAPGGHFLESEHTLRHCREQLRPGLFLRSSRDQWQAEGGKELSVRVRERYHELMGASRPLELPAATEEEMDRIVRAADRAAATG